MAVLLRTVDGESMVFPDADHWEVHLETFAHVSVYAGERTIASIPAHKVGFVVDPEAVSGITSE